MSEKGKNVTRMRKRSVSFSEEITIIGYHIVPEIDREKNERKKLDKIDRSRKFEPKTLNEQNDDVSDSNIEVALPKPFLTNLTHKKMMTNSNKSSCTNPQYSWPFQQISRAGKILHAGNFRAGKVLLEKWKFF